MKKFIIGTGVVLGVLLAIDYAIEYIVDQEEVRIAFEDLRTDG